jgi:uncharacterized membrane protein YkoI
MSRLRKIIIGVVALAALALGGSAIAGAASNGDGDGERADGPDQALTGTTADQAGAAATKATGGGTVRSIERSDEGGSAAYEVKVVRNGKTIEVTESSDYAVVKQQADDDQGEERDQADGQDKPDGPEQGEAPDSGTAGR